MRVKLVAYAAAMMAGSLAPQLAVAATMAVATEDLNIRSGPGPQYPVIGAINANGEATIEACIQDSRWCRITYRGRPGWAYTQYMQAAGRTTVTTRRTVEPGRTTVTTTTQQATNDFGVPTIVYDQPATVGAAPAEVVGDIVDAPAGPAVIAAEPAIVPPPTVQTYVVNHPLDPIYLNGEAVVGAGLPPTVALRPVPDSDYDYAYVNRQPVLVEPDTRRIVYVYR